MTPEKLVNLNKLADDLRHGLAMQDRHRVMPLMRGPILPTAENRDEALAFLDRARFALDAALDYQSVRQCRDGAIAMAAYAREAKDKTLVEKALRLRLLAERKAGDMLKASKEDGTRMRGGEYRHGKNLDRLHLKDIGVSRMQSSQWQQLAALPPEDFEVAVNAACAQGRASSTRVLAIAQIRPGAKPTARFYLARDLRRMTARVERMESFTSEEVQAFEELINAWRERVGGGV
jgi:hypothetical protein